MSANKRQQVTFGGMVRDWRGSNGEDDKVGCTVDNMAEYEPAPFSSRDENEIVACGQGEDAEYTIDGSSRPGVEGSSVRRWERMRIKVDC
jgi:hypothetical protein